MQPVGTREFLFHFTSFVIHRCEVKNYAECGVLPPTDVITVHNMYSFCITDDSTLTYVPFYGI